MRMWIVVINSCGGGGGEEKVGRETVWAFGGGRKESAGTRGSHWLGRTEHQHTSLHN